MVYKNGFAANSHMLAHIIHAAMRDAGWDLVAGLSDAGYDSVFYSTGESGNEDIYVRVAAGQYDKVLHGDAQFPSQDGYTGFVNLFAYQYCDENGEGYSEIGKMGPAVYIANGESTTKLYHYNFAISNHNDIDGYTGGRYNMQSGGIFWDYGRYGDMFDGRSKLYTDYSGGALVRHNLGSSVISSSYIRADFFDYLPDRGAIWSRRSSREPLIWATTHDATYYGYGSWFTYNQLTGEVIVGDNSTTYADIPWVENDLVGLNWAVQGPRRNGNYHLYLTKGYNGKEWARYDMFANEWESLSPEVPQIVSNGSAAVFVMREWTGYEYDRIYTMTGDQNYFYSIAIDDDGDPVGIWIAHDPIPSGNYVTYGDRLWFVGGNRLFYVRHEQDDLYEWQFPSTPEGVGSWELVKDGWFDSSTFTEGFENGVTYTSVNPQNHLISRVEVDEASTTEYWIFANKDRIIVLTESYQSSYSSDQNMAYAGLFESNYSRDFTSLSASADAGTSTLDVNDSSVFQAGGVYQLTAVNDPGFYREMVNGERISVGKARRVTVNSIVSSEEITIDETLEYDYPAGSKIGPDVQPVGVYLQGLDKMQTLTNLNLVDTLNTVDPVFQTCSLDYISSSFISSSERLNDSVVVSPIIMNNLGVTSLVDSETRGRMIGVYYSGAVSSGSTVQINGQNYKAFSIFESSKLTSVVIGPME